MLRSRLGPIALETPLGDRHQSGSYWRSVHLQQRKQLAIKIFSLPFGGTPEARQELIEEWEKLKKLRHTTIARCYGGGFEGNDAYLAYEFIDGPSLEEQVDQRGRLAWQMVLDLAESLAEALHYAHQRGVIHGQLEPSQIRLAGLSPVIVDFRYQRTTTAFRSRRPPAMEDFAYRAPELVAGSTDLNPKVDLYSVGAILFFALTGRPPIQGDTPEEMALNAEQQIPPQVAQEVLDCPTFLSVLLEQLLRKDPVKRPHSAEALLLAVREVRRRATSGASVIEHVSAGFSPLKIQADTKEARDLLGRAEQELKPPRPVRTAFWESPVFLGAVLASLIGVVVWALWPPGQDDMRLKAEKLLAGGSRSELIQAKLQYLEPLQRRFPEGPHASWAAEQIEGVEMVEAEHALQVRLRKGLKLRGEGERLYAQAQRYEQFGDPASAIEKYRSMATILDDVPEHRVYVNLARRQIADIESRGIQNDAAQKLVEKRLAEADDLMRVGKVSDAREIWKSIIELYDGNAAFRAQVQVAAGRLDEHRNR